MRLSSNVHRIHPVELLRKQVVNGEFIRWDTIIRCIAAEHYIKTGTLHSIYFKDCKLRHLYVNGTLENYDCRSTCKNYRSVVRSFIRFNSFSMCNPVAVDNNLVLSDGTHRLGAALAMELDTMFYEVTDNIHLVLDAGGAARLEYYKERFTNEEVKLMTDKYNELSII